MIQIEQEKYQQHKKTPVHIAILSGSGSTPVKQQQWMLAVKWTTIWHQTSCDTVYITHKPSEYEMDLKGRKISELA